MTKLSNGSRHVHVSATVRLTDGTLLIGTVNCGLTGKLDHVLGMDNAFVEFRSREGQQRFITRHQIASVEAVEHVAAPSLPAINDNKDPYEVLKLFGEKTVETAREAYVRLTKMYHPDKWSAEDIPSEITHYAADKTRQINAAYTIVRAELQEAERVREEAAQREKATADMAPASPPQRPMFGPR